MSSGRKRAIAAVATLGLILLVSVWGGMRLSADTLTHGTPIKVGLIQGNIAQTDKWNPARVGDDPRSLSPAVAARRSTMAPSC